MVVRWGRLRINAVFISIASSKVVVSSGIVLNTADLARIRSGGVCIKNNCLSPQLLQLLCDDISCLADEGSFKSSGLTPRLDKAASSDDELFGESDRQVCVISEDMGGNRHARHTIGIMLEDLAQQLRLGLIVTTWLLGRSTTVSLMLEHRCKCTLMSIILQPSKRRRRMRLIVEVCRSFCI